MTSSYDLQFMRGGIKTLYYFTIKEILVKVEHILLINTSRMQCLAI